MRDLSARCTQTHSGPESLFCRCCQTKTISTRPLHPADSWSRVWFCLWESISPPLVAEWVEGKAILSFCLASLMSGADPVRSSPASSLSQRGAGPAPAQWTTTNTSKQDGSLQDLCLHLESEDVRTHWPQSAPFHASLLSIGRQRLCLSNSCTLQQGWSKGRMRPPCITDAKASLHTYTHTCSWCSASNSCLHWAPPESGRLLHWHCVQVGPREGLETSRVSLHIATGAPELLRSSTDLC